MKDIPTIIKPPMISWARNRLGYSMEDFARCMGVKLETVRAWEDGAAPITWKKAKLLAAKALVPFGCLFLTEPPDMNPKLPDFRTIAGASLANASPELQAVIQKAQERQAWLSEHLQRKDAPPLPFAKSLTVGTPVAVAADRLRAVIGNTRPEDARDLSEYFADLVLKIENAGVTVMRNSIVENSTNRPLNVEEFRGFALFDEYAPVIFINSADARNAQLFTLVHELVHVFIGEGGVSNGELSPTGNKTECYCNRVAAEFLVPASRLKESFAAQAGSLDDRIENLSAEFKVSRSVIVISCRDNGLVDKSTAEKLLDAAVVFPQKEPCRQHGGPDFYKILPVRIGRSFARYVLSALSGDDVSYTQAFRLLGIHDAQGLKRLEAEVSIPAL